MSQSAKQKNILDKIQLINFNKKYHRENKDMPQTLRR